MVLYPSPFSLGKSTHLTPEQCCWLFQTFYWYGFDFFCESKRKHGIWKINKTLLWHFFFNSIYPQFICIPILFAWVFYLTLSDRKHGFLWPRNPQWGFRLRWWQTHAQGGSMWHCSIYLFLNFFLLVLWTSFLSTLRMPGCWGLLWYAMYWTTSFIKDLEHFEC